MVKDCGDWNRFRYLGRQVKLIISLNLAVLHPHDTTTVIYAQKLTDNCQFNLEHTNQNLRKKDIKMVRTENKK